MRARAAAATVMLALALVIISTPQAVADVPGDVRYDADFLRSLQLPDGAILSDVTRRLVDPYLANYAAWGLARASRRLQDRTHGAAAMAWLIWYQDHMDSNGIVHDQNVVNGVPKATADEDSVDACSGVFLLAARELLLATDAASKRPLVERFRVGISKAVRAIESLRDADGLTWAKPTWRVKYLMDNAEAYAGLLAAGDLGSALGDGNLAAKARQGAARSKAGMMSLWNAGRSAYDWALHADGYRQVADWSVLYPDAVEQAWTVAYGVSDTVRARSLMARFLDAQPNWDRPVALAIYWDGAPYTHTVDFWPVVGFGMRALGDVTGANSAAALIRAGAWQINRQPPYSAGAQGQLIVLESGGMPTALRP